MEIDFEYLTQVFLIIWFLTTIPIKFLIDEFRLIIYDDEIQERKKEIERDGHILGKKYSNDENMIKEAKIHIQTLSEKK